jgi:GTPase SAR1 family protein
MRLRKRLGCSCLASITLARRPLSVRALSSVFLFVSLLCPDQLKLGEVAATIPTIGLHIESVQYESVTLNCWDTGIGSGHLRPLWRHFYNNTDGIIFVVNSDDREQIEEAASELQKLLSEEALNDACLFILANKQDLPTAMPVDEVMDGLRLRELRRRAWHIRGACATKGEGLLEGLDWLMHAIKFGRK